MKKLDDTLTGKTVLVTAGNQGGGAAVALRFAASGANVVVIANKESSLAEISTHSVTNTIISSGGSAMTLEVDLGDVNDIHIAIEKIIKNFGSIDIIINNYSMLNLKNSKDTTSDEFNAVIKNIYATFFLSQACVDILKKSENPHVINIAPPLEYTVAMKQACQHHLLFSISKYAMSLCTIGMAKEFEPQGIAFNSLWQERPIATQTLKTNFSNIITQGSNKPEAYAEAAYLISLKPSNEFTGNFCIDETVLRESGIDPAKYAVDPEAEPIKDIFLPGVDYDILNEAMQALKESQ